MRLEFARFAIETIAPEVKAHGEHKPPGPHAPDDWPILSFRGGEASFVRTQTQITYVRLLKDGRIVVDQVSRTALLKSEPEPR